MSKTGNALGGAGSGAVKGAMIGSVVPGVGTAAGAAIGGGLGLLAGFNKKDPSSFLGPAVADPGDPRFYGIADDQGKLAQQYSLRQQPRGQFEQLLRQRALETSTAPTAQTMAEIGQLQAGNQGLLAQNISNLAQRGGISSGARERLARASQLQGMRARQDALRAGLQREEATRRGLQQTFATQEGKERQFDIQNAIRNQEMRNQFEQDVFRNRMNLFAADKAARAQLGIAQSTGGLFGSGGTLGLGF